MAYLLECQPISLPRPGLNLHQRPHSSHSCRHARPSSHISIVLCLRRPKVSHESQEAWALKRRTVLEEIVLSLCLQ